MVSNVRLNSAALTRLPQLRKPYYHLGIVERSSVVVSRDVLFLLLFSDKGTSLLLRFISDLSLGILAFSLILAPLAAAASNEPPLVIGIDADMSGGSARSGLAIQRGAEIAISEINTRGGVLGRPLELLTLDHRGNPERGAENIKKFAKTKNLIGLLAGLHTPVALHELKLVHKHELIFLVPWAAGTQVVDNGFSPNFVFRVSVRDQYAGEFLVNRALKEGHKRLGLLLENTGWGRSNEKAMRAALGRAGLVPAGVSWFHWGAHNMHRTLRDLIDQKIDAVILVANAPEGTKVVHAMSSLPKPDRRPIISHWGIAGGSFFETIHDVRSNIDLRVLQTFFLHLPNLSRAREARNRGLFGALYGRTDGTGHICPRRNRTCIRLGPSASSGGRTSAEHKFARRANCPRKPAAAQRFDKGLHSCIHIQ